MSTNQPRERTASPARRRRLLLAAALVILLAAVAWRWGRRAAPEPPPVGPPPDPRLTFATPYQNVRPDVAYVGGAACTGCHKEIAESYRHHPMGRSTACSAELVVGRIGIFSSGQEVLPGSSILASRLIPGERYDAAARDSFQAFGLEHTVALRGSQVIHRETLYDSKHEVVASSEAPLSLAIGSGTRGRSYAITRGDAFMESPISWYNQGGRWDLSPGYQKSSVHFERAVTPTCLYCHTNAVEPVEGTVNTYRPPLIRGHTIGCERCHGPGALHVQTRRRGDVVNGFDTTIVNPARLEPSLRESVCEQCHLQGRVSVPRAGRQLFDFRPGLPYHLFWSIFVPPDEVTERRKTVRTVEQMHASRCYEKSNGALGCISCHDPHELPAPEEKGAYYRARCLNCHAPSPGMDRPASKEDAVSSGSLPHAPGCTEAEAVRRRKADNCVACHMPPVSSADIAHTANTEHTVPRRPDETEHELSRPPLGTRGQVPLVHFHADRVTPDDKGLNRDLGIALVQFAIDQQSSELASQALPLLEEAVRQWPDDLAAREAQGTALGMTGEGEKGLAAYEAVLARAPRDEHMLLRAAEVAGLMGLEQKAGEYYERALGVNPHAAGPHFGLGRVLTNRREWQRAAHELETGLGLQPFDVKARQSLVLCYLHLGQPRRAREEYERLLRSNAPNRRALADWFAREVRQAGP
jgi:hypothetical protein